MSKLSLMAVSLLILNACQTAPLKKTHWDDLSYGYDRPGESVVVTGPVLNPSIARACDLSMAGNGSVANWEKPAEPTTPAEEIYQKLAASNTQNGIVSNDARKLIDTALEIHRSSGHSVIGLDTCDILKGETLPNYLREVEKSYTHLQQTGEFCAVSFAAIAINDQIAILGRTPNGAVSSVAKYEKCALGPPGTGKAAMELAKMVESMRKNGRNQLNPDEYRCSR